MKMLKGNVTADSRNEAFTGPGQAEGRIGLRHSRACKNIPGENKRQTFFGLSAREIAVVGRRAVCPTPVGIVLRVSAETMWGVWDRGQARARASPDHVGVG